jgi:lipopolysaccharide/colanic/teichoic acid biosynthesis glycosyltransferase
VNYSAVTGPSFSTPEKTINILGTRGIPAQHGGFETFAQKLALYLVERGWNVCVYCQVDPDPGEPQKRSTSWNGIELVRIQAKDTAKGTIIYDLKCVIDVANKPGIDLVLGYNTAVFNIWQRVKGRFVAMNMDGLEWKRKKWKLHERIWLFVNELAGSNFSSIAIADHPEIKKSVGSRSFKALQMIPYGADQISNACPSHITELGLEAGKFFVSIARIEPENSILELIKAFEAAELDGYKLVILGKIDQANAFHRQCQQAASENAIFPGAIYDANRVAALRHYCRAYLHGHQVGGTNPSLVEALGASNCVLAHDNHFNRWTAGNSQLYFSSVESCAYHLTKLAQDEPRASSMRQAALQRYHQEFQWDHVLRQYEAMLIEGLQSIEARSHQSRWNSFYTRQFKRIFDLAVILLTAPITVLMVAILALMVRRDGGPAFVGKPHLKRDGTTFICYKLRTTPPPSTPLVTATENHETDTDISSLSSFLRRSKFDELPQLLSVLRNDMSLVGPRPLLPEQLQDYNGSSYDKLKPGVTGLWQVSDGPNLPRQARGEIDDRYAASVSFWQDTKIMIHTLLMMFTWVRSRG